MTATATMTDPDTVTDAFEALQARYPKVRKPIVMALHILTQNPGISLDDAKARAEMSGIRITAASVSAAQRLLSRQDGPTPAASGEQIGAPAGKATPAPRRTRGPRSADTPLDVEDLIRGTVAKLQAQGNAEAERLREAIRRAVAVLEAAIQH